MASNLSDLLKAAPEERAEICQRHGEFRSKRILGAVWTKCPECAKEENAASAKARQEEEARAKAAALSRIGIPPRFMDRTFENFRSVDGKSEALSFMRDYAENFAEACRLGRSIIMIGEPGVGKTHLACALAAYVASRGYRVIYTSAYRMFHRIRGTWSRGSDERTSDVIEEFASVDLLILDEVGLHLGTEADRVDLFDVINERYGRMLPTVMISNLDREGTEAYLGTRIYDRMRENGGRLIAVRGSSMRGLQLASQPMRTATA